MSDETPQQNSPQELARQLSNVARMGTIKAVSLGKVPRCRVAVGDNTTDWVPWLAMRAGGKRGAHWWAPVTGEQCLLISAGGDFAQGVALVGIYSDANPAPETRAEVERTQWSEKDFSQYEPARHTTHHEAEVRLEVGSGCSIVMGADYITLKAGAAELKIGPKEITANVDVVGKGVSLVKHVHTGVRSGGDLSGVPK